MAWTQVIIFQVGSMVTHTILNTYLRDNMLELGTHGHAGGSGSGSAAIGNLTAMTVIDAVAPGAPGGTLTYLAGSATALIFRSGAGAARIISDATHTHGGL